MSIQRYTLPTSSGPTILDMPDLIDVVVISDKHRIAADKYRSSGLFTSKITTKEPNTPTRHMDVIVTSCNISIWLKKGRMIPNAMQFNTVCNKMLYCHMITSAYLSLF